MLGLPAAVRILLWDVPPETVDLNTHGDYVMERVMTRGNWEAMRWLRRAYAREQLADFVRRKGRQLAPRDEAYWALIAGVELVHRPGGGRPGWAG
jgi:hypothetical protein